VTDPIEAFLSYAEHDRNRSPHTLARYYLVLSRLAAHGPLLTIGLDEVQEWWESRFHLAPSTRANELFCVRSFYKWATKFGHREDDPTRRLDPPKVNEPMPRMIGRTDFENLLGELTEDAPDLRRAYALGGYAGLRVSECAALDWRDVDLEQRRLFIRGKGMKERPVPVSSVLADYMLPNTGGNVVTAGGKPYTGAVLQRKLNRHMARHGIEHTFHDFRKRGASIALSKGANPAAVRVMFGWSSMETVSHYAVVGDSELDRIAEMLV
jgi:site-specific recombinase XerD